MSRIILKTLSALEKVFLDEEPMRVAAGQSMLMNETGSFQIAYTFEYDGDFPIVCSVPMLMEIESPLKDYIRVRRVDHVPVRTLKLPTSDGNYLRSAPGLYPDILRDVSGHAFRAYPGQWDTVWFDIEPNGKVPAGVYPITVRMMYDRPANPIPYDIPDVLAQATYTVEVIDAALPEQELLHTKWLHTDCLAQQYDTEIFSEKYWELVGKMMNVMAKRSVNVVLTPIHTPPLDTRVGGERPTVQLVDVFCDNGKWSFNLEKLDRWVALAKKAGMKRFEMAHLFTQWGAKYAPKIMATVDGVYKRVFGWDTEGTGEAYVDFLHAYVPAICAEMKKLGELENCIWHISDEPHADHLEGYLKAKGIIKEMVPDGVFIDALSDVSFYKSGAVEKPVPAVDHIEPFLEADVPGLWCYYCIGQHNLVSNLFVGMPAARTRIYAEMLYKYDIEGILQWGWNFYNAQYSDYPINPFVNTDSDGFAPSGDAFQVYPGRNGEPIESIRVMLIAHMAQDLRAFRLLESLAGREFVLELIDGSLPENEKITFKQYPKQPEYILDLRERVNAEIKKRI